MLQSLQFSRLLEHVVPGPSVLLATDSEHQELETVQAALAKTPRLAKLLGYLVENYFEGTTEHLTEFNIATEVFDRNPEVFTSSEDAIARVETHRLRKRLKLFYEGEGRQHAVQISIPLGTYVPVFTHQKSKKGLTPETAGPSEVLGTSVETKASEEPVVVAAASFPETPVLAEEKVQPSLRRRLPWKHAAVLGLVVFLCGLGLYTSIRFMVARTAAAHGTGATFGFSSAASAPAALPVAGVQGTGVAIPFRMIAGYNGPPQRDAEGFLWQADRYFQRGWYVHRSAVFFRGTTNPLIFQYGRSGDMDYDIPLKPGTYELHLYFMQPAETALGEDAENRAVFNLTLNNKLLLDSFDIESDAMGRNTADEKVFRDVSPAADGKLHLHFSTVIGTPSLSAISILEGTPGKMLPIRLVTQPMPRTDPNGILWRPDNYFIDGRHLSHNLPSADLAASDVLSTERYGHFTYALPVDSRDEYTVSLYFVESFFGTPESSGGGTGSRVFRVLCNGNTLLDHFDIFKEVGNFHVVKKTFYHIRPTAQGKLNLTFEPIANYATVSGIEVLDESK
jgi:hypothetical protein